MGDFQGTEVLQMLLSLWQAQKMWIHLTPSNPRHGPEKLAWAQRLPVGRSDGKV